MAEREIIFTALPAAMPGSRVYGRELHFTLGDDKCVDWQVVPRGEKGHSLPFEDSKAAERFAESYAHRLGFTRRLEDANSDLTNFLLEKI